MSLSFNREIHYIAYIPRRRDFTRPSLKYNPDSEYRKPYNLRFREQESYHPADWIVGDYLYGFNITSILK